MIQIEQVPFIPKLAYGDYAWKELQLNADAIATVQNASEGIWVVSADVPLLVVGVIRNTFLSKPRLWFLLCHGFAERRVNYHLRALKMGLQELDAVYPNLETFVEEGWVTGERFARFCGFRKADKTVEVYGKPFKVWEK